MTGCICYSEILESLGFTKLVDSEGKQFEVGETLRGRYAEYMGAGMATTFITTVASDEKGHVWAQKVRNSPIVRLSRRGFIRNRSIEATGWAQNLTKEILLGLTVFDPYARKE